MLSCSSRLWTLSLFNTHFDSTSNGYDQQWNFEEYKYNLVNSTEEYNPLE